ncbi:tRNA (guanosine(37)-N1)-methyltransferase TrmD [Buchnera aphidicola str. APS (Acyrthosiphon pisum)]|uniref:tRNA (guanine-N(1)-)-methyltransferase n=2 Tax=Buchnera aphidicola TaxID=9 RepID=TRMD_BUCAI|nr:tRNA (guanosine(37)-N1)-methyltransferase TrmD [Buchnera aphidicola]P57476.1 RecName: Full=tRNA (guanine-N(1)-)-methyltransferase; AltName: Full=M1G-methyltransferase; AltName: Full=tRNA [GM37] methyltransferase [Buchnera aphidicola str. APS (Acyrthosiphon pisum)]pir/C84976/ tRNA (guanine-N1-)-methyltransferase (EC 2.1.1.31) [imported] - Buchnera sp. (strain APS) [Buchnera sp. (in: enterobacteria)]ACL30196.1 tRNA (guanine-N1)-methyltransferase [Buchnera aphidicola str. Tuc7 (Acyrthosiphon pis
MKKKYNETIICFNIITIFPEMFYAITNYGIIGQAIKKKIININFFNPRNFSKNKYKSVDDRPYGGGPGMLMSFEPLYLAIQQAKSTSKNVTVIYLSPQGKELKQNHIEELLVKKKKIVFICGRYEGIDQRIIDNQVDEEWSIGSYILTGGELAAMVMIDAISRLIPGVIKTKKSIEEDSFTNDLLDYPNYTRPKIIKNMSVPQVLLSGNHNEIRLWRLKQSLGTTWIKRPDLIKKKY